MIASNADFSNREAGRCCRCTRCNEPVDTDDVGVLRFCTKCLPVDNAEQAVRDAKWQADLDRTEAVQAEHLLASKDKWAADQLRDVMSEISEDYYCAGWLNGLEYSLWGMLEGCDRGFGFGSVTDAEIAGLRELHERCGGWWRWEKGVGEVFVATEEWRQFYAEHETKDPRK
jgi:hypothetical protein